MFSFPIFVRVTQSILLRGTKCISFSRWQVRSVVILSEERWVLKCVFEPRGLIKKGEEMTLFSLHHNSNFLGLVPPALWRDPGHCAGGRRGKTERITHPGKTDVQCGVLVFSLTYTHTHAHAHTHTHLFFILWKMCSLVCVRDRHFLYTFTRTDNFFISVSGDPILNMVWSVFGTSQSPRSHVDHRDPPFIFL